MKYGIMLPSRGELALPENIIPIAKKADELGFSVMMFPDHIVLPNEVDSPYPYSQSGIFPATDTNEATEQLTMLAFLAGQTESIRLVTSGYDRAPPAPCPHCQDTVHHRRAIERTGYCWSWSWLAAKGVRSAANAALRGTRRGYRRIHPDIQGALDQRFPSFEGKYCSFSDISFLPKPVQKPHPPIWVGGESRRALRRAAELGDGWQPIGTNNQFPLTSPEQIAAAMKRLDRYVQRAGRPQGSVEVICRMHGYNLKTNGGPPHSPERPTFAGRPDQIASDIRRFEDMGVSYLIASFVPVAQLANSQEEMIRDMEMLADHVWPKV